LRGAFNEATKTCSAALPVTSGTLTASKLKLSANLPFEHEPTVLLVTLRFVLKLLDRDTAILCSQYAGMEILLGFASDSPVHANDFLVVARMIAKIFSGRFAKVSAML
jgi:hypothetical protein